MKFSEAINQGLIRVGISVSVITNRSPLNKSPIMGRITWLSEREFGISRFDGVEGTGPNKTWRFLLGDAISDITFLADTGYPPLLYEVKIADKPQGNWRPKVQIEFLPVVNALNIDTTIMLIIESRQNTQNAWHGDAIIYFLDIPFYYTASRWDNNHALWCNLSFNITHGLGDEDNPENRLYLDWRPGLNPSYADYAAHFKKACDLVVKEYDRRCKEALSSGISDPITITPDTPENRKEVTRKIRILNQE